jgi:hypothetical protein
MALLLEDEWCANFKVRASCLTQTSKTKGNINAPLWKRGFCSAKARMKNSCSEHSDSSPSPRLLAGFILLSPGWGVRFAGLGERTWLHSPNSLLGPWRGESSGPGNPCCPLFFFFLSFTPHPKGLFFVLDLRALRLKTSGWYACSQGMRRERESSHVQKKEDWISSPSSAFYLFACFVFWWYWGLNSGH